MWFFTDFASAIFPRGITYWRFCTHGVRWPIPCATDFLLPRAGNSTWCLRAAWWATTLPWSSAGGLPSSLASTLSFSSWLMLEFSTSGSRISLPGEGPQKWSLELTLASSCEVGCWWVTFCSNDDCDLRFLRRDAVLLARKSSCCVWALQMKAFRTF